MDGEPRRHRDRHPTLTMKPLLLALALSLASCSLGPDWSPEVVSHAASWSAGPVYAPNGAMLAPGNREANKKRPTIFNP